MIYSELCEKVQPMLKKLGLPCEDVVIHCLFIAIIAISHFNFFLNFQLLYFTHLTLIKFIRYLTIHHYLIKLTRFPSNIYLFLHLLI